ncbi:hypothetical protein L0128_21850 [candidate division KSB1 bacterium]|nr:hypothetical protein [candidate division KSB1 bacterium]
MQASSAHDQNPCAQIAQLLIQQNFETLTAEQQAQIQAHLKQCPVCQEDFHAFLKIQSAIQFNPAGAPKPDPAIALSLQRRMQSRVISTQSYPQRSWEFLKRMLAYRIPVYQPILIGVIVLLVIVGIQHVSFFEKVLPDSSKTYTTSPARLPEQLHVLNAVDFLEQQEIGITVQEDTALCRFIVTAM